MKKATVSAAILTLLAFSVLVLARCGGEPAQANSDFEVPPASSEATVARSTPDGTALITVDELRAELARGGAVIVDVRNEQQFAASHIAGSVHIPFAQVASRASELPKDKLIVLYCTCPAEESSAGAAQMLASVGVTNTAALRGGLNAWADAGLPVQAGI
jgi:rhodanese-related sulfurtransferase